LRRAARVLEEISVSLASNVVVARAWSYRSGGARTTLEEVSARGRWRIAVEFPLAIVLIAALLGAAGCSIWSALAPDEVILAKGLAIVEIEGSTTPVESTVLWGSTCVLE
jgi:hypothetical protein